MFVGTGMAIIMNKKTNPSQDKGNDGFQTFTPKEGLSNIYISDLNHNKLSEYKSMTKNIDQIKKYVILKVLCPKVSIHVSNLYDSSEVKMTSELKL